MRKSEEKMLEVEDYALMQKDGALILKMLQSSKNLKAAGGYQPSEIFMEKAFELGFEEVCKYMLRKRIVSERVLHSVFVNKDVKAVKSYLGRRPPLLKDEHVIMLIQMKDQKLIDDYFYFWAAYIFHGVNCLTLCNYLKKNSLYSDYMHKYLFWG